MKRFFSKMMAMFMVVVLLTVVTQCGKSTCNEVTRYIPGDATFMFSFNFQEFMKSSQYANVVKFWNTTLSAMPQVSQASEFCKTIDLNLERDLNRLTMILWPVNGNMDNTEEVVIIEVKYQKDKILNAIKSLQLPVKEETYNGVPLLIINKDVMGFLDESHILVGKDPRVRQVIDLAKGKGDTIEENEKMEKFVEAAGNDHILIVGFILPEVLKKAQLPIPMDISKLDAVVLSMDKSNTELVVSNKNPEVNKNLVKMLNEAKVMVSGMTPQTPQDKMQKTLLEKGTFNASDDEIHITIPSEILFSTLTDIASENLMVAMEKNKQKSSMMDMKSIGIALESYLTDNNKVPEGESLEAIKDSLQPFHIKILPLKDGWGNNLVYIHGTGETQDVYSIASPGRDGIFKGWEQSGEYIVMEMKDFDNDIIFCNGVFTYAPKVE